MKGHMTPTNQPSNLGAVLLARPRPSRVVTIPGRDDMRVRLIIPADVDHAQCTVVGDKLARDEFAKLHNRQPTADEMSSPAMQASAGDAAAREMLARCCFEEDEISEGKYPRVFPNGNFVSRALSEDEITILYYQLQTLKDELGPRSHVLLGNPDIARVWVRRLKEEVWSAAPLASLAFLDLAELAVSFARLIDSLLDGSGDESQDSLPMSSADSGESNSETSAELTTSSGGSLASAIPGILPSEPLPPEVAAQAAASIVRKGRKPTK
jgi:hypothetical protein